MRPFMSVAPGDQDLVEWEGMARGCLAANDKRFAHMFQGRRLTGDHASSALPGEMTDGPQVLNVSHAVVYPKRGRVLIYTEFDRGDGVLERETFVLDIRTVSPGHLPLLALPQGTKFIVQYGNEDGYGYGGCSAIFMLYTLPGIEPDKMTVRQLPYQVPPRAKRAKDGPTIQSLYSR